MWYDHYKFLVMYFGLTNDPIIFILLMNRVFQNYHDDFVIVFIDNILVYSNNEANHVRHLSVVLQRLCNEKLFSNFSKCDFLSDSISFLDYVVTKDGDLVDMSKVAALHDWARPIFLLKFNVLLGLVGYYQQFGWGFSSIAALLTKLTEKKIVFQWSNNYDGALKSSLSC